MDINKDLLRWGLLIAATPIWWPFLKLLWQDFNRALEEEGGIFGRPPPPHEVDRIRREKLSDPDPLVSERWARPGERRTPRMPSPGRTSGAAAPRSAQPPTSASTRFGTNPRRGGERGPRFR